jgi:hypothetical protein
MASSQSSTANKLHIASLEFELANKQKNIEAGCGAERGTHNNGAHKKPSPPMGNWAAAVDVVGCWGRLDEQRMASGIGEGE